MDSRVLSLLTLLVVILQDGTASAMQLGRQNAESVEAAEVLKLIERIIPGRQNEFSIIIDKKSYNAKELDSFEFHTVKSSILQITATSGVAAAWAFNHFLKYYCRAHISWSGSQLQIPRPLPSVTQHVQISSPNRYRYYQNVCTSSYSFVWWNWTRWEKEIDWMALNGINLPLAFTGQEEIWRRVYTKLGVSQKDLGEHFAGPAFLAWGRMGNMRGWGGPLPYPSWYKAQLFLQHKILARMRAFGMIPVLPGFAGHVPYAIKELFPKANIVRLGDWGGFNSTYCCTYFLDPTDPLFQKIGSMFIEEQAREYNGTDHIYNADSFNEMTPPSSDPLYLASSSKSILGAMQAADPEAIWLMQGWLFQDTSFWKPTQMKALLTGVPIGKMIVLDLFAEVHPIWKKSNSFYGQPFIWCMLHNFGGNLGLYGTVERVSNGPLEARAYNGSTMIGTGMTPEGIEQNDFIYDLMSEMGWRSKKVDLVAWTDSYAERRYGKLNSDAKMAWGLLLSTVYNCSDDHADHNHGIPVVKPTSLSLQYSTWYNLKDLSEAWQHLISSGKDLHQSQTYRYDLVDVGRQVLQDVSFSMYKEIASAYKSKNVTRCTTAVNSLLMLLGDLNKLLASDEHFLLGKWLENAKALGTNEAERALYEFNARNQVTMWGPDDNIRDYANKMWGGLMNSYYLQRWQIFGYAILEAVKSGKPVDFKALDSMIIEFERNWNRRRGKYPVQPYGDSLAISEVLYERYSKLIVYNDGYGESYRYKRQSKAREGRSYFAMQRNE